MCACAHTRVKGEDNLLVLVFAFLHVGPRDKIPSHWPTIFMKISSLAAVFRMCTIRDLVIRYLLSVRSSDKKCPLVALCLRWFE